MRRVAITGVGLLTPLGYGKTVNWTRLLEGKSGIISLASDKRYQDVPSKVAGIVPRGEKDGEWNTYGRIDSVIARDMSIFTHMGIEAAEEALCDAGWDGHLSDDAKNETGVCFGAGIGNVDELVEQMQIMMTKGARRVSPKLITKTLLNMTAGYISRMHGFTAFNHTASTACATGTHSIGDAFQFIQLGHANVAVAGGSEASVHPLSMAGFAKAKSLATAFNDRPAESSRPFDEKRCGFVMAEGAGAVVLEELEHAKKRGARIYAELVGYGLSSDTYHITAPNPNGDAAYLAMKRAMDRGGQSVQNLDYINAHATSTKLGDAAENSAICRLLAGVGRLPSSLAVSSTKGATGHLLGAAGAVEAVFTVLSIYNNVMPPTLNLNKTDLPEHLQCNYVPNNPQEKKVNVALSNSLGFGGTNASLCFKSIR